MEKKESKYRRGTRSTVVLRTVSGGILCSGAIGLLCCLLAVSCTKEPLEVQKGDRVEIVPTVSMPWEVSAEAARQGGMAPNEGQDAMTRAAVGPTDALDLYFARADANSAGAYISWGTSALRASRATGTGNQALTFNPTQYYQANNMKTKMVGWYPGGGTATGQGNGYYNAGTVEWTFDGSQDIMTAPLKEGSRTSALGVFAFSHQLTQVQFYIYAESGASAEWGTIQSVSVTGQANTAKLTVGSVTTSTANVAFSGSGATFTSSGYTARTAPEGTQANAAAAGTVMMQPRISDYELNLTVTTANKGSKTLKVPARTYPVGEAVKVYIKFTKLSAVVETIKITDWVDGGEKGQNSESAYPYVVDGNKIVFIDIFGHTTQYPIHDNWTETPAHSESAWSANNSGLNTVGAKFEVASTDASTSSTWANAKTACQNYDTPAGSKGEWRLPTIRELKLIYDKKSELTDAKLPTGNYYWSATELSSDYSGSSYAWYVNFTGGGSGSNSKSSSYRVRCIRDL